MKFCSCWLSQNNQCYWNNLANRKLPKWLIGKLDFLQYETPNSSKKILEGHTQTSRQWLHNCIPICSCIAINICWTSSNKAYNHAEGIVFPFVVWSRFVLLLLVWFKNACILILHVCKILSIFLPWFLN